MNDGDKKPLEKLDSPPIQPIYWQESPNDSIVLGNHLMAVSRGSATTSTAVVGEARLRFVPNEACQLFIPTSPSDSPIDLFKLLVTDHDDNAVSLTLPEFETSFDVFLSKSNSDGTVYVPSRVPILVRKPVESISRVVFHLLNWPEFRGPQNYVHVTGVPPLQGFKSCGRFILECEGWEITVAATDKTSDSVKAFKEAGGFSITHAGLIRRIDRDQFSSTQLEDVLVLLTYFFSFALGRWTGPNLSVGFDSSGDRVYEEWGTRRCDSGLYSGSFSWFDSHHSELFASVLPGFWRLWKNKVWHKPLTEAIYWYVNANRGGSGLGVDSALLFSQAALELLSWTYCVLDRGMVSANAFKPRGLSAADKLRLLVSSLDIPLEIPKVLSSLHAKPGKKWDDSMDAITDVRNGLVHPGSDRKIPDGAYYDAWRLSMWYLDLILLRLCGHSERYANRLSRRWTGTLEAVPWNSSGDRTVADHSNS